MAAKCEQPMTPSINRMIKLLEEKEKNYVTKERVIRCEAEILKRFDFDFGMLSPLTFIERFMRLAEVHNDFFIDSVSVEILKLLCTNIKFLNFKPSLIAAATLVVSMNL